MMSAYYYIVFIIVTLVCFVLTLVLFLLTALFDRDRVVVHWFSKVWSWLIFAVHPCWRRKVEGMENVEKGRAYVIVANHQSMLDIPHLYVLPVRMKWVSKREVYKIPFFGWVLRMHRDIGIRRMSAGGTKKFLAQGKMWLDRGVSVIMFPEGTRSATGEIGRFKEGAFLLAKSAGVGILPVVGDGTGRASAGWKFSGRNTFTVRALAPIDALEVSETDVKAMTERVRKIMVEAHTQVVMDGKVG